MWMPILFRGEEHDRIKCFIFPQDYLFTLLANFEN